MLLRICLILTIIAGIGTAYLGFMPIKEIITTTREARDDFHKKWDDETALYTKTHKELESTKTQLATTTSKLKATTSELEAANSKNDDLSKQNTDLTDKLGKATTRAETAEQTLEKWRLIGTPESMLAKLDELKETKKAYAGIQAENKIIAASRDDYKTRYYALVGPNEEIVLPTGLKGRVMAVDPKFAFVVLNIGDDQGVKERGELMVARQGKLIGKVRITSVKKDSSVASILAEWKHGQVMEGDQVLY